MGEFTLPTNIRQIGSIGDGLRIYMEDYVFTYLHQYAEAGGYDERAAFLVGRHMVIDGQQVLFINGAIQGKEMETRDGLLVFTEKTNVYAESMIKEFFAGMEVVGWMQSQPSYGVYLNQQYGAYHRHVFSRDYQVMFVMDPLEKTNNFYAFNAERDAMQEVRGYFIYYDKNKNMHEYMLHDRAADKPAAPSAYVEVFGEREDEARDAPEAEATDPATRAEELIRRRSEERTRKRSSVAYRRTMNLMTGLSAALFIVCFVMGAGLIQNRDEISSIKTQLSQLSTAYRNLFVQMSSDGTSPAFAAETEDLPDYAPQDPAAGSADGNIIPEDNADGYAAPVEPQPLTGEPQGLTEPQDLTGLVPEDPDAGEPAAESSPSGPETVAGAVPVEPEPVADAPLTEPPADIPAEVLVNEPDAPTVPEAYTIQPGDSLLGICIEFYGDGNKVDEILALNGIGNADMIVAGKTIALPQP